MKYNSSIMKNNRIPVVTVVSVAIFSAALASSSFLSLSHQYDRIFYAFAQTQRANTASDLSLSNLIKQGSPLQGSKSSPVTVIDFSDFQCHLCNRFVKATEPQINSTYVQTGKIALVFEHLPNR